MAFGVTEKGFIPKRLSDILESLHTKIENLTDPETGEHPFINESSDSVLMQFTDIIAEELSICWEQAYASSVQFDPLNSFGDALRGLVQLNGLTASYGSPTEISMILSGTPGVVIQKGSLISDSTGKEIYSTVESVTIQNNGEVSVDAICTENGPKQPQNGTIFSIQTPIYGWNSATNTSIISVGSLPDTDEQLHILQERATSATSYRQVDSVYSGIVNIPGVTFARIYVNPTTSTDSRGIPAKSLSAVVVGGTNENIANVLRLKSGMLDNFYGNTTVNYTGILGDVQTIKFTRPTEKEVYVDVDISFTDTSLFPTNGEDLIKEAIVKYAQYNKDGTSGFAPGENVIISRLYTPINSVLGFKVNSIKIGFSSSSKSTSDLSINWNEVAKFGENLINITVTN